MKLRQTLILIFWFSLHLLACRAEHAAPNVVAKVNDIVITTDDYRKKLLEIASAGPSQSLEEPVRQQVLNDLIERALLLNEAEKRNIAINPGELESEMRRVTDSYPGKEFEKMLALRHISISEWRDDVHKTLLLKKVTERISETPTTIDDALIATYYNAHLDEFKRPERVQALHIHVDSEQNAFNIQAQLRKGAPFETLAREYSLGPEAQSGGDLGYFTAGVMPEIFDATIFALEIGKISKVVSSEYGYHIFKLIDRVPAQQQSLIDATPTIRATLIEQAKQKQYAAWLESHLKKSRVMKNLELIAKLNL